jgi:hypothetical protein
MDVEKTYDLSGFKDEDKIGIEKLKDELKSEIEKLKTTTIRMKKCINHTNRMNKKMAKKIRHLDELSTL